MTASTAASPIIESAPESANQPPVPDVPGRILSATARRQPPSSARRLPLPIATPAHAHHHTCRSAHSR